MSKHIGLGGIAIVGVALTLVLPLAAQQPAATSGTTPAPADAPTVKDPMRFSAFAVSLPAGASGVVEIAIERWTTDVERQSILDVLAGASFKQGGQTKLLDALQKVTPRNGYIRTPNSLGWDLKYARENQLPDGTRQVVIATDKPVASRRGERFRRDGLPLLVRRDADETERQGGGPPPGGERSRYQRRQSPAGELRAGAGPTDDDHAGSVEEEGLRKTVVMATTRRLSRMQIASVASAALCSRRTFTSERSISPRALVHESGSYKPSGGGGRRW